MGLESANYFVGVKEGWVRHEEVFLRLGARKRDPFGTSFDRWIVRTERYWIDLMSGDFGSPGKPAISVRVALCNPPDVESALRDVLTALLREFGGKLHDVQTNRSYGALDDASWSEVLEAFAAKRSQFRQYWGTFEAAISGEEVFSRLDEYRKMN